MKDVSIEKATLLDVPSVATMIYEIYNENDEKITDALKKEILAGVVRVVTSDDRAVFVASVLKHDKKRPVGMIGVRIQPHPIDGLVAIGDYLFVESKFRGSDLSLRLLQASKDFALSKGAVKAYTEAKPQAIETLMKFGFEHESTIMSLSLKK